MVKKSNAEAATVNGLVARAQARAEARAEMQELDATTRDDVLSPETKSAVAGLGMGASPMQATNDADKWVRLYHAFDGRSIPIPMYMVERKLMDRFETGNDCAPEYVGTQVWFASPQPASEKEKPYHCRLSVSGNEDMKAEMLKAGAGVGAEVANASVALQQAGLGV